MVLATSWPPNPNASHATVSPITPQARYNLWIPELSSRALKTSPTQTRYQPMRSNNVNPFGTHHSLLVENFVELVGIRSGGRSHNDQLGVSSVLVSLKQRYDSLGCVTMSACHVTIKHGTGRDEQQIYSASVSRKMLVVEPRQSDGTLNIALRSTKVE